MPIKVTHMKGLSQEDLTSFMRKAIKKEGETQGSVVRKSIRSFYWRTLFPEFTADVIETWFRRQERYNGTRQMEHAVFIAYVSGISDGIPWAVNNYWRGNIALQLKHALSVCLPIRASMGKLPFTFFPRMNFKYARSSEQATHLIDATAMALFLTNARIEDKVSFIVESPPISGWHESNRASVLSVLASAKSTQELYAMIEVLSTSVNKDFYVMAYAKTLAGDVSERAFLDILESGGPVVDDIDPLLLFPVLFDSLSASTAIKVLQALNSNQRIKGRSFLTDAVLLGILSRNSENSVRNIVLTSTPGAGRVEVLRKKNENDIIRIRAAYDKAMALAGEKEMSA